MVWWWLVVLGCGGGPTPDGAADPLSSEAPAAEGARPDGVLPLAPPEDAADVARWRAVLDAPDRDAWQRPAEVVRMLQLQPGQAVADLGAGTGYFSAHLARAVGPEGTVIAVDVAPALIEHMTIRAAEEGTPQVQPRLTTPDDPGLAPGEVDRILMVDTVAHIDDRVAWFKALRSALTPGGTLVIVDFKPGELPVGPPPERKLPLHHVRAELETAGWTFLGAPDVLPHQYFAAFEVSPHGARGEQTPPPPAPPSPSAPETP